MTSLEEKRIIVIKLHKEGGTIRQIAEKVHMSFRDIKKIIDETYPKIRELSPETKALKLFSKGMSLMNVITKLDIPFDLAEKVEQQYLRMQKREKLAQLYNENEDYISLIMEIARLIKEQNLTIEEIDTIVQFRRQIPILQRKVNLLISEIIAKEKEKAISFSENSRLKIMNNNSINALNEIQYQYTEKQRNIQELISTELHLKKIIHIDREIVTRLRQR